MKDNKDLALCTSYRLPTYAMLICMNQPTKNPLAPPTAFAYGQERALSQAEKMLALSHFIFAPLSDFDRMSEATLEASAEALFVAVELAGEPYSLNLRRYDAMHNILKQALSELERLLASYPSAEDLHALQERFAQHEESYHQDLHALHQANAWLQTKMEANHAQLQESITHNDAQVQAKIEAIHQANTWLQAKIEANHAQLEAKINALTCEDSPNSALALQLEVLSQRLADHYADLDEKIRIARQIEEHSTLEVYARLTDLAQLSVENQERISALEAQLAKP